MRCGAETKSTWSCRAGTSRSSPDAGHRCTAGRRSPPGSRHGRRGGQAMADNVSQQLMDMWKKQVEEGSQAWLKMMGQGQTMDPQAFWRPFMDQGMAAWAKVMTQGAPSTDLMAQWKQFLDQWIAAWSRVLEQAMGTEAFAQAMGKQLEGFLNVASPVKKAAEHDIADRMESVAQLKSAVYGLEGRLDAILKRLTESTGTPRQERA